MVALLYIASLILAGSYGFPPRSVPTVVSVTGSTSTTALTDVLPYSSSSPLLEQSAHIFGNGSKWVFPWPLPAAGASLATSPRPWPPQRRPWHPPDPPWLPPSPQISLRHRLHNWLGDWYNHTIDGLTYVDPMVARRVSSTSYTSPPTTRSSTSSLTDLGMTRWGARITQPSGRLCSGGISSGSSTRYHSGSASTKSSSSSVHSLGDLRHFYSSPSP